MQLLNGADRLLEMMPLCQGHLCQSAPFVGYRCYKNPLSENYRHCYMQCSFQGGEVSLHEFLLPINREQKKSKLTLLHLFYFFLQEEKHKSYGQKTCRLLRYRALRDKPIWVDSFIAAVACCQKTSVRDFLERFMADRMSVSGQTTS